MTSHGPVLYLAQQPLSLGEYKGGSPDINEVPRTPILNVRDT